MSSRQAALASAFIAALALPAPALAAIEITEVMYDPQGNDSGREWAELYNDGSAPVAMTGGSKGWKFNDGSNHLLIDPEASENGGGRGSLTLSAGGYAIIASDPASFLAQYPGGSESVIKSSLSFNNTGGTLTLYDDSGAAQSSLAYAKDTGGSGDGNSLQRMADGSLMAAAPTPGAPAAALGSPAPPGAADASASADSSNSSGQSSPSSSASPVSSYVPPPVQQLFADAGGNRSVIADADVEFTGRAYDRKEDTLTSGVRFIWNFGDGSTGEGPAVLHHFQYPGRYAAVLTVTQGFDAASDQIIVAAEQATLALSLLPSGGISIANLAGRDLDLSDWIIAQQGRTFTLPAHSVILAGSAMRVPQATLGFWSNSSAELEYPNGALALAEGQHTGAATSSTSEALPAAYMPPEATAASAAAAAAPAVKSPAASSREIRAPVAPGALPSRAAAVSALPAATEAAGVSVPLELSLVGLAALVLLGAGGVWYAHAAQPLKEAGEEKEMPGGEKTDADRLADEFEIVSKESL